jgi:FtsP/CotA-like multicopper oxidase with cupredoxin domain
MRVLARFAQVTGKYVMHSHNLAHEDHSMMANFEEPRKGERGRGK